MKKRMNCVCPMRLSVCHYRISGMKNEEKIKNTCVTLGLLVSFMLWTIAFRCLYVQAIRVNGSSVGFATLNGFVHRFKGVHMAI
ncbi:MAG: hypothetical protein K2O02_02510 [Lachnospiraceae bacterium]|nr:hypothetical protein [Lachnospiraceae bacterium]